MLALMIFKQDLNIISIIGIVLLIGIVKKNAIMMIDFALQVEREEGKKPIDSIFEACMLRFRPILMTTMAALLGALPLALGTGTGYELAPTAWHYDCWRADFESVAHALHHAGGVFGIRPYATVVGAKESATFRSGAAGNVDRSRRALRFRRRRIVILRERSANAYGHKSFRRENSGTAQWR